MATTSPTTSPTTPEPATRRPVGTVVRRAANPATVLGAFLTLFGLLVLGLPGVGLATVDLVFGLVLTAVGLANLVRAVSGRGPRLAPTRWAAGRRAPFELLIGWAVLRDPVLGAQVAVWCAGTVLLVRGSWAVLTAWRHPRERRAVRLAAGAIAVALGVLCVATWTELPSGITLVVAVTTVVAGVILLVSGLRAASRRSDLELEQPTARQIVVDAFLRDDVGPDRRAELASTLYFEPPGRTTDLTAWWVMLLLSAAIATFAILQDSTAVVIGAMLVAPLMVPILGLAGALVNGWSRRAVSSLALVALGAVAAVVVAYVMSGWAPAPVNVEVNTQVTSRIRPDLLDLLIAVSAGAAGAFATMAVRVASSIAGVAIAVALVPPLSVVGICLAGGLWPEALGAFLLFMTNVVAIIASAAVVFVLGGFADPAVLRSGRQRLTITLAPFVAVSMAILIPLVFTSEGVVGEASQTTRAHRVVDEWAGTDGDYQVLRVEVRDDAVQVDLTGPSAPPSATELHRALQDELGREVTLTLGFTPSTVTVVGPDGVEDDGGLGESPTPTP
ncbi:DUF389 domain-containing protein [Nocardioides sp. YIM 152588]|uniref:DUF389 domain-containing protein n=1 Tax=Nocardioides sp. YIM 152588 TaxID=3158259 RepID=UPI0032E47E88